MEFKAKLLGLLKKGAETIQLILDDPIGFLGAIGSTVSTSVSPKLVASLAPYATQIRRENVYRAVVTYPLISTSSGDPRGWIELPNLPRIRELAKGLFPPVGTVPVVPRVGSGAAYGITNPSASAPVASASSGAPNAAREVAPPLFLARPSAESPEFDAVVAVLLTSEEGGSAKA